MMKNIKVRNVILIIVLSGVKIDFGHKSVDMI